MNTHDWFYIVSMLLFFTWGAISAIALALYLDKRKDEMLRRMPPPDPSTAASMYDYPTVQYDNQQS